MRRNHLRGHAEEVGAVLPLHARLIDHPHVRLVDERGRLQRVAGALAAQVVGREAAQLRVDERQQLVQDGAVSLRQLDEQLCNFFRL